MSLTCESPDGTALVGRISNIRDRKCKFDIWKWRGRGDFRAVDGVENSKGSRNMIFIARYWIMKNEQLSSNQFEFWKWRKKSHLLTHNHSPDKSVLRPRYVEIFRCKLSDVFSELNSSIDLRVEFWKSNFTLFKWKSKGTLILCCIELPYRSMDWLTWIGLTSGIGCWFSPCSFTSS